MVYADLIIDPVIGALFSYAVYALAQLGKLLVKGVRTMPLIRKSNQTPMEITSIMQLYIQQIYLSFPSMSRRREKGIWRILYIVFTMGT